MGLFSVVLIAVVLLAGCAATVSEPENTPEPTEESTIEPSLSEGQSDNQGAVVSTGEPIEGELDEISTSMIETLVQAGYSVEQASEIQKILNTVSITSITIENMTGKADSGLNAVVCYPNGYTERNRRFYFTTEDGVLFYAGFLNEDLYDAEKGGFLKSYTDVHVPETKITLETYDKLRGLAEEAVKSYLNYPSSADFGAFDWGIGRSNDKYKIQGKVSAQNGFGVEEDLYFGVWFIVNGDSFDIEGIEINGTRVK